MLYVAYISIYGAIIFVVIKVKKFAHTLTKLFHILAVREITIAQFEMLLIKYSTQWQMQNMKTYLHVQFTMCPIQLIQLRLFFQKLSVNCIL